MKVYLPRKVHAEMMAYAKEAAPSEIGGVCLVTPTTDGNVLVKEMHVIKQTVTSGNFDIDDDALFQLDQDLICKQGKTGQLCMLWHSHVNMGVTPSGHDNSVLDRKASEGSCVSMIINLKNDMSCMYSAVATDVQGFKSTVKESAQIVFIDDFKLDMSKIIATVKKHVKPKTYPTYTQPSKSGSMFPEMSGSKKLTLPAYKPSFESYPCGVTKNAVRSALYQECNGDDLTNIREAAKLMGLELVDYYYYNIYVYDEDNYEGNYPDETKW